jgi:pyruvate dehydrogenase E2 component (dihydrolipoamide acetyltransferase)
MYEEAAVSLLKVKTRGDKLMAEQVLMTALSPTMEAGVLVRWHKQEGDWVDVGDILCEVETDKATMDYESTSEGTLLKILVREGEGAAIGDIIAIIGEAGEKINALPSNGDSSQKLSDGDSSQELYSVSGGDGSQEIHSGVSTAMKGGRRTATNIMADSRIKASPLARKLAEMNELSLNDISGTGPDGRIIKADVEKLIKERVAKQEPVKEEWAVKGPLSAKPSAAYTVQAASEEEIIPVSPRRKVIAQRLSESKYSAPHYYLTVTVTVDNLINTRNKLNESLSEKLSINAFLIKYAAEALKKHQMVNASWLGDTILKRKQVDIGLAVALSDGLITPVVRDCGNKGLIAIENELHELIEKARNNKLMPEEYQNPGFTISNLGSLGIEEFTAIINPPGSAILAVGQMKKMPVVGEEDNIKVQTQMKMTLSCDHRVIDGAVGAAFLKNLKDIIEDPFYAFL